MEKTERKEGYYWVSFLGMDLKPFWAIGKYTPAKLGGMIPELWSVPENILGRQIDEINETRIPSPDESDNLQWLFNDLVKQGLKFTYDPATKTCGIFHKEPPRIIDVTVSAGFDFDNKNKADA